MLYIWYQEWAIPNYKCIYLMRINGKDPSMFWSNCKNISNMSDSQFNSMKNIALVNIQDMAIIKITIIIIMNFNFIFYPCPPAEFSGIIPAIIPKCKG